MSLDSISLAIIRKELVDMFKEGKIVNIFQVKKYKIIFEIRPIRTLLSHNINKKRDTFYIHISIDPSSMEIYFSESKNTKETISSPFLNLLKNHLIGGKILDIKQPDFDRILHFIIQPYLKFGQTQNQILIIEFMGKHGNMILLKENTIIEGSIKLVDSIINRYREILPGKFYIPPPSQNKLNPLKINRKEFFNIFYSLEDKSLNLWKLIQDNFIGISPQNAKEMVLQANLSLEKDVSNASPADLEMLWTSFNRIKNNIKNYIFQPTIFLDPLSEKIKAYSLINSIQFPQCHKRNFKDVNSCLEFLFTELEKEREIISIQNKLDQIISKNMLKINNKINDYQKKLEEVKNCEKYKINGELIKANLAGIKRGDTEINVINYYSPGRKI